MVNYELESRIIGNIVSGGDGVEESLSLKEEDFTTELYKRILRASKQLQMQDEDVNIMTIYNNIKDITTISELAEISNTGIIDTQVTPAIKELKATTLKRRLNTMAKSILASKEDGATLTDQIEKEVYNLREETSSNEFDPVSNIAMDVFKDIEDRQSGKVKPGLPTGYKVLDEILGGGMEPGKMIVIGARPSMGKTALALNIAERVTRDQSKNVAIFSLEMPKKDIVNRLVTSFSRINTSDKRGLTAEEWGRLADATGHISNRNLFINDDTSLTVPEMLSMSRKLKRKQGLDLIVIDYLQFIHSNEPGERMAQLDTISRQVKAMAKSLEVPVILIASLNRGVEARMDKRPMLSDLRETGQIEYDADTVLMLYRDEYYNANTEKKGITEVIVAKNRGGRTGIAELFWIGNIVSFENMSFNNGGM